MNPQMDGKGQTFFEVGRIRITCVQQTYAGAPGIRIQHYKKKTGKSLHPGAEIPLDRASAGQLSEAAIRALLELGL